MSDIDEALVALSELFTAAWRGGHCHPEEANKRRVQIEQALERQQELQDALKHTTDLLDSRDFAKRHYEMVQRVKDNRAMLAAAPKGFDSETAPYSGGNG